MSDMFGNVVDEAQITHLAKLIAAYFNTLIDAGVPEVCATELTCCFIYTSTEAARDNQ